MKGAVTLAGVIELTSQRESVHALLKDGFPEIEVTSIPDDRCRDSDYIVNLLAALFAKDAFDSMLVACDPRHRDPYFTFAVEAKVDVFVDKPIFALDGIAHDPTIADTYLKKLEQLNTQVKKSGISLVVQAQRRDHVGYQFIKNLIDNTVNEFNVPVTSLHIQHADGMWVLPNEWEREHHPYKYGFGKLFHSGYHFVDMMAFLLENTLKKFKIDEIEAAVKARLPKDSLNIWENHHLLPSDNKTAKVLDRESYGEQDFYALLDFRSREKSLCVADLSLLQNSYSDRNPAKKVTDSYKGIGRVRHERVDLKISSILDVQVHSYQSRSTGIPAGNNIGDTDHFDILIFKNPFFYKGDAFEKISLNDLHKAKATANNEKARASLFQKFLERVPTGSDANDHHLTSLLTGMLYRNIALSRGRMHVTSNLI